MPYTEHIREELLDVFSSRRSGNFQERSTRVRCCSTVSTRRSHPAFSMLRVSLLALSSASAYGFAPGNAAAMRSRAVRTAVSPTMSAFYDLSAPKIDGTPSSFSAYKGKPVLILNVASL